MLFWEGWSHFKSFFFFLVIYFFSLEAFRIFLLSSVFCGTSDHILLPGVLVGTYFHPLCGTRLALLIWKRRPFCYRKTCALFHGCPCPLFCSTNYASGALGLLAHTILWNRFTRLRPSPSLSSFPWPVLTLTCRLHLHCSISGCRAWGSLSGPLLFCHQYSKWTHPNFKYHPTQPLHILETSLPGRFRLDCLTCISNVTWLERKRNFTPTSTPLLFQLSKKHWHPLSCSSIQCRNCPWLFLSSSTLQSICLVLWLYLHCTPNLSSIPTDTFVLVQPQQPPPLTYIS